MYCYSINNFDCPDGLPICVRDTHQDPVSLLHRHDYLEIALVRLGHGIHTLHNDDGGKLESSIIKGDVFTILSGEAHSYRRCRDFRVYNICIAWSYWERIAAKLEFLEYYKSFLASRRDFGINLLHLTPAAFVLVEELVQKLRLALMSTRPSRFLAVELTLLELLYSIVDGSVKGVKRHPGQVEKSIFEAVAKMEEHPEKPFSIGEAAKFYGMSVSSYAHKFKAAVGVSPTEYCILLRLENARMQLASGDMSIMEIAITNGFCDGNYLARLFRQRYGMTPLEYRKIFRSR